MSSSALPLTALAAAVVFSIVLYGAYWAFAIRRALVGRLYRRQALWIGTVGTYFATFGLSIQILIPNFPFSGDPSVNFSVGALYYFGYVIIFAWIDATVRVARLSDPLLRDTFHWKKLRKIVWVAVTLGTAEITGLLFSLFLTQTLPTLLENLLLIVSITAIVLSGVPALLLSAARSRDTTLRRHMKWFGLFVGLSISTGTTGFVLVTLGLLARADVQLLYGTVGLPLFLMGAFSLYRSARSLAPIGRLYRSTAR